MANIRFIVLTRRIRDTPFKIRLIDDTWFIEEVLQKDLSPFLKTGDRLLVSDDLVSATAFLT